MNESQVSKVPEIYKIMYGLTLIAMRKKKLKANKSHAKYIKKLTVNVCKLLPKQGKKKMLLTKLYFVENLYHLLFEVHYKFVNAEKEEPGSQ